MSYEILIKQSEAYVILKHWGEINNQELSDGRNEALKKIDAFGYRNLLVDVQDVIPTSLIDAFTFTTSHVEVLPEYLKIALLSRKDDQVAIFAEAIAQNRGINMRMFHEKNAAVVWLCSA